MRKFLLFAMLVMAFAAKGFAADPIPLRPNPPRLVNDIAGILGDTQALEDSLEAFARRTSNQIVVVTVNDLAGYDPTMFAYEIGQQWGVGTKDKNNGLVLLIKPKTDTRGTATIAPGYGLEGALPDALCRRIIEREMIPHFKQNDYTGGTWAALKVIMPIAAGEYSEEQYLNNDDDATDAMLAGLFLMVVFFLFIYIISRHNGGSGTFGGGGPIIFPPIGGGSGFDGGGSSGFGGFGGFGGGSFGGGGASGSW